MKDVVSATGLLKKYLGMKYINQNNGQASALHTKHVYISYTPRNLEEYLEKCAGRNTFEFVKVHEDILAQGAGVAEGRLLIFDENSQKECKVIAATKIEKGVLKISSLHFMLLNDFGDISEDQKDLIEREKHYSIAIKGAGIQVWEFDIVNRRIIQPQGEGQVYGFGDIIERIPESLIEAGFVQSGDIHCFREMYDKVIQGEEVVTGDFCVRTADGEGWLCEHVTYVTEFDDQGRPIKAYGAAQDVSQNYREKRKYEDELDFNEGLGFSVIAACRVNLTKEVVEDVYMPDWTFVDKRYSENTDYRQRTLTFLEKSMMSDRQNDKLSLKELGKAFLDGKNTATEIYKGKLRSGEYAWIKVDVNILNNPITSEIIAFYYNKNITREITLQAILDSVMTQKYEEIGCVNIYNHLYTIFSMDQRRFSRKNICGNYEEEIKTFCEMSVVADEQEMAKQNFSLTYVLSHLAQHEELIINVHLKEINGEIRLKRCRFSYLDEEAGTVLYSRSDIEDVVRQEKDKQDKLEIALEQANAANNAKSEFLSRVSHDLRTPMNAIIGLSSLGLEVNSMEEYKDYLRKINLSGCYLLDLINDTLDVNRIENDNMKINYSIVYSTEVLKSVISEAQILAKQKGVNFTVDPKNLEKVYIRTDPVRIKQIFLNLLSNSIKFTPVGGQVTLITERISRDANYSYYKVIVKDNGIGMSEEFLDKLYEPFVQENEEIAPEFQGSGLGMTIVKKLVDIFAGRIEVKSKKNVGTEFTLYLDFERIENYSPGVTETPDKFYASLDGTRILLCEDHPLNQEIAVKILKNKGCIIDCANNGQEGVDKFSDSAIGFYDAILMDVRMPIMDGLAATKKIRTLQREDSKTIPIIAMTANAYDQDKEKTIEAGMNGHLTKPVSPDVLYSALGRLLTSENE